MRFTPASFLAALLLAVSAPVPAATPASGSLTDTARSLSYIFPAEARANASPIIEDTDPAYVCDEIYACDTFELTVTLPSGYMAAHPNDVLLIEPTTTTTQSDIDSQLEDEFGTVLTVTRDNPPTQPTIRWRPQDGTTKYLIQVVPGTPHEGGTVNVTLLAGDPPPPGGAAYAPRFQATMSPPTLANSAGEPSIGYNPATKRALYQAGLETLRVTFPEQRTDDPLNPDGLPEACDALWEDVSSPFTGTITLDPIGIVDPTTGRGYAGQLGPKQHTLAYTDDDGETWLPGVGNFPGAAGVDHQTIGWGPYVAGGNAGPLTDYPNALYYCSQDIAYANCSRSDDGGLSFLPPVPAYTLVDCGGLHGHIRAAPDGTVYLPNKNCNNQQGVAVSEDNGVTWAVRRIPDSSPGDTDPQMALADDGTGYFCYTDALGLPRVAVTRDKGVTWTNSADLGTPVGVKRAVFAQGIAGDGDRAACGFIGTDTAGNSDALDFPGIWYAYIAVTYDRGQTWSVTNVTPGDPVQGAGGICTGGTTCGSNRNLLDFNEMTLDELGRPILGFADGCIGSCVTNPASVNRADKGAIARAVGGKSLYAALDRPEPHAPQAACLSGTRDDSGVKLAWRSPADDGTSPITGYRIYRGTTQGAQSLLATVTPKHAYDDGSASPDEPEYFYKIVAVNAQGDSVFSNLIRLPIGTGGTAESPCTVPGITVAEDGSDDATTGLAQHDVRTVSLAEPFEEGEAERVYITMKVEDLSTIPPNTVFYVMFRPEGDTVDRFVSWDTDAALGGFSYGHLEPGAGAGTLTTDGDADAGSVANPDGTITWILTKSKIAKLAENTTIGAIKGEARALVGAAGSGLVTVVDDTGAGSYDLVGNAFCTPNTPPQAMLAVDRQTGTAPLTVAFDASGSFDADAEDTIVEYRFDFGDGSDVVTQAEATIDHTYDTDGFYNARVWVADSRGLASSTAAAKVIEVTAVYVPAAPVADAGADAAVLEGALHSLDGLGSSDPNGDVLAFAWSRLSGPEVTLMGADTATPSFVAPEVCADDQLVFRLTVTDSTGLSSVDEVAVLVSNVNQPPVANAGADFAVKERQAVLLSAAASADADCEALDYRWTQTGGPAVVLQGAGTAMASFTAPAVDSPTVLQFRITLEDPSGTSSFDDVTVTVEDDPVIGDNGVGGLSWWMLAGLGLGGWLRRRRGIRPVPVPADRGLR